MRVSQHDASTNAPTDVLTDSDYTGYQEWLDSLPETQIETNAIIQAGKE